MNTLRKLGVYLNGGAGDAEALAFTGLLARMVRPGSIGCVHMCGLEEAVLPPAPDPQTVREQVQAVLPDDQVEQIDVQVCPSGGLHEVLRTAREADYDLIVVGRHLPHDQRAMGAPFYRLARKTPCSVLVVPQGAVPHLSRLLVHVDGSEHSKVALQASVDMARAAGGRPQLLVQAACSVGYGYHYAGMSFEEACRHFGGMARRQAEALIGRIDTHGVHFEVVATCSDDVAAATHDLAAARHMDAIVIGSRGATLPANALLGVTTERVLLSAPCPVLVVKRKGETFRFLDAVFAQLQGTF